MYRGACQARNKLHPTLFLLGLFAAQGQRELASLRRDEFDLEAGTLAHRRNKTSQMGVYWLPPELIEQLKIYFKKDRHADGLALHTLQGTPLVAANSDSVQQAWLDWRERAGLRASSLGFYCLRRFFGDYATRHGGDAAGDAALAHTAKTVRGRSYSGYRDFDQVKEIGQKLHAELIAAGMFEPVAAQKTSPSPASSAKKGGRELRRSDGGGSVRGAKASPDLPSAEASATNSKRPARNPGQTTRPARGQASVPRR
jgi:hypothetical protein